MSITFFSAFLPGTNAKQRQEATDRMTVYPPAYHHTKLAHNLKSNEQKSVEIRDSLLQRIVHNDLTAVQRLEKQIFLLFNKIG